LLIAPHHGNDDDLTFLALEAEQRMISKKEILDLLDVFALINGGNANEIFD